MGEKWCNTNNGHQTKPTTRSTFPEVVNLITMMINIISVIAKIKLFQKTECNSKKKKINLKIMFGDIGLQCKNKSSTFFWYFQKNIKRVYET